MADLFPIADFGEAFIYNNVVYEKVASGVQHVPDEFTPDSLHSDFTYNIADLNGDTIMQAARHAMASVYAYDDDNGEPDGWSTVFPACPYTGVLRMWSSSINGGVRAMRINGTPIEDFNEGLHQFQVNAKPIPVNAGDLIEVNSYWSTTYYGVIYPYVYNGGILP